MGNHDPEFRGGCFRYSDCYGGEWVEPNDVLGVVTVDLRLGQRAVIAAFLHLDSDWDVHVPMYRKKFYGADCERLVCCKVYADFPLLIGDEHSFGGHIPVDQVRSVTYPRGGGDRAVGAIQ